MAINSVLIAKNVPLTFRLRAREIWVSADGEVTVFASQFGPQQAMPRLTAEYLESLCAKFYFGGNARQNAIADIMLLNGILTRSQYDSFYYNLSNNLNKGNLTVIYSPLFQ